jgi:hypothetical protein
VSIIEIERLEPASDDSQKKAALSACIAAEIGNGIPRDQAVAMCNSMVAERTQMKQDEPTFGGTKGGEAKLQ